MRASPSVAPWSWRWRCQAHWPAAAPPIGRLATQPRLRLWLQIAFWAGIAAILLALTGVQFGQAATVSILAITITKATPLTLGALAGISCERSGVVNIGIEGMMLTAAFTGFMTGVYSHSLAIALIAAVASGGLLALLHAVLSITFRVDQIISATVVNILGGALGGLGGAYFTLESVPHFEALMTNGRGFIALAAMIFGKWTPFGAWGAALLFGVAEAIPTAMQLQGINVPFQIVGLLPYVLTIVVVAGAVGRAVPPAADGQPYVRA